LTWLFIHLLFLVGVQNRFVVFIRWALSFISRSRAQRLMTGESLVADFEQSASRAQTPDPGTTSPVSGEMPWIGA
jgi:hypothetical protein